MFLGFLDDKEKRADLSALGKVVFMSAMFNACLTILRYPLTFYGVTFNLLNVIAYAVVAILLCKFIYGMLS